MSEPPTFDLVASSLRADAQDLRAFAEALAVKLEGALASRVAVERKGRLLGGAKQVRRIEVDAGERRYELDARDSPPSCARRTVVGGIALKTEELGLDAWVEALSADLAKLAESSERDRLALERLLGM